MNFDNVTEWRIPVNGIQRDVLKVTRNNVVLWEKETIDYTEPFYVENNKDHSSFVNFTTYGDNPPNLAIYYSTDRNMWQFLGNTSYGALSLSVPSKSKIWFRCRTDAWSNINNRNIIKWGDKIGGNIMSMLYGATFTGNETAFPGSSTYQFHWMFNESDITDASKLILPATTVADHCYTYMFRNCTSLVKPPKILPATVLASYCYGYMFQGCTSLTSAPALPAITLTKYCYQRMFFGCTSLTSAPALPATTLAGGCYGGMFYGCTSLTTAPELPATALNADCYSAMFSGCTSLTQAPELPATTLTVYCYYQMFQNCTSLNNIKCLANNISTSSSISNWVQNVSSTGTFTKKAGVTWPTGTSGIPSGWTVVEQ